MCSSLPFNFKGYGLYCCHSPNKATCCQTVCLISRNLLLWVPGVRVRNSHNATTQFSSWFALWDNCWPHRNDKATGLIWVVLKNQLLKSDVLHRIRFNYFYYYYYYIDVSVHLLACRLSVYVALLVVSKILKAVGLFIAYDLLKLIPIVVFLFLLKAG